MPPDHAISGLKVLLTGGAGFIGSHLADRLAPDNDVVLFDSFTREGWAGAGDREQPDVELVKGDVLDLDSLTRACRGVDVVIHLAAIAGVETTHSLPVETLNVNVLGTVNVLQAAAAASVSRLVYFSTSEVYGSHARNVAEGDPAVVGAPTEPRWGYAAGKLLGEFYALRYGDAGIIAPTVIRPFNVYGPRQFGGGAVFHMCSGALTKGQVTVRGAGTAIRAWCHVDDLVDGVVGALGTPASSGEIFNIGNPEAEVTSGELAAAVADLVPGTQIRREPLAGPDIEVRIPDVSKAGRLLGFRPRVSLDEGLRATLEWYREALAP